NTITFQSESGDSTAAVINSPLGASIINLRNVNNIKFSKLGFNSNQWNDIFTLSQHCHDISIEHCYFAEAYSKAVNVFGTSTDTIRSINVINNNITTINNGVSLSYTADALIYGNNIKSQYGVTAQNSSNISICNNKILSSYFGIQLFYSKQSSGFNNYILMSGDQSSVGFYNSNNFNSRVVFNTIDIKNTDLGQESIAFKLEGNNSIEVKNNIFNISTAGYPTLILESTTGFDLDYNNYFSPSGLIGKFNNTNYSDLAVWGAAVSGDANSTAITPMFGDNNNPLPYQRDFNGAAIPVNGILLDINGNIRNDQAPDIGCVEFMIDFGIIEMINPSLECFHDPSDSVKVFLRQFGDLPFQDLSIAYRMNYGTVHTETIAGTISNDLVYTFKTPVDISPAGEYTFKVWLINTRDDNSNNDTLIVTRYTKPAPVVDFTFSNECTGREVHFAGSASVASPYFIESYEWIFNNSDTALTQNPVYEFPAPGTYPVILRAYSNAGCYNYKEQMVTIDNYEKIKFDFNVSPESCYNLCNGEVIINSTGGEAPLQYYLNDVQQSQTSISDLCSGDYKLRITDNKGCEASADFMIEEGVELQTGIISDVNDGFIPLVINLSALKNSGATYEWYYQGSKFDTAANTTITITDQGAQNIILKTTGPPPGSCSKFDTLTVKAMIFVDIFIPNAFTPNNDGFNDTFGPRTEGIQTLEMNITDRNGRFIYAIDEVNGRWDGTTESGDPALEGIYFYVLDAIGYDHKAYIREGSVTLYRDIIDMTPNPVKSHGYLDLAGHLSGEKELTIFTSSGFVIKSWQTADNDIDIDLTSLKPGLYFLKAKDDRETVVVKFIKE
ncbi:MAG: gliding motility-associated C-terminal domain-containing protein, partial [Lentimicrobiaceae bacterium]